MALSNDVSKDENDKWIGESTELSLFNFALSQNHDKHNLEKDFPRIAEIPFDASRKCMTTLHQTTEGILVISKGAVEMLIKTPGLKNIEEIVGLEDQVNKLSNAGYRVLGYSYKLLKDLPEEITPKYVESSLSILGYAAIIDPPREEVKQAIAQCKAAGITPIMITGDHKLTATTIAKALGIIVDENDVVLSGAELETINEEEFSALVEEVKVYARVDPEQKLRIVNALQNRGNFVAMTGDGVNDAPALKNADIGIAMGINGTEVSKEAAHMILLDDNFSSVIGAIKHGRQIFDNILKFIKYIMTGNSGEIWAIMLAPFLGLPIPLIPIHILWINLVTDGLPGLALASEAAEPNIMKRKPRMPTDSIFSNNMGWHIFWVGLLMGLVTLGIQVWAINNNNAKAQTMAFSVLCFSQMGHALAIKSDKDSIFKSGLFSNKPMIFAISLGILFQMMIIYIPALNKIFKTEALSFTELALTIAASSIVFLAVEFGKNIRKRKTEL
jgi:Ca2+-transporting ATPase